MAYPIASPYHFGAICSQCGSVLEVSIERSNNRTAVNRVKYHCDTCKFDFTESPQHMMGSYGKYTPREDRKAPKGNQKAPAQVPMPAVPLIAGVQQRGNAVTK